jgi:hypothetical protein
VTWGSILWTLARYGIARYTEPFALLVAQLAYERNGGPELAYRFDRFRN